ncbi:MAG: serine hydrolase [Halieaceae bacterium]|nr:serine hydrolase [Halieaceae bacterium]
MCFTFLKLEGRGVRYSAIFIFLGFFSVACSADGSAKAQIAQVLKEEVIDQQHYPFLSVYVQSAEGSVLVSESVASDTFFTAADKPKVDDWMRIWSMSKLVTTVLTLDLIEDGLLTLDDEVISYLPELADVSVAVPRSGGIMSEASAGSYVLGNSNKISGGEACDFELVSLIRPMTVRDLMLHTAGFYYATTNLPCLDQAQAQLKLPLATTSDEWLRKISTLPLIQQPSDNYYYGLNTTVLGFLLERASGKNLQALLEERITKPYDINGLSFLLLKSADLPPRVSGRDGTLRLARDYELDIFGGEQPPYGPETTLFLGGEGLVATAPGFAKFLRVVFFSESTGQAPLLDSVSVNAMTSPQINENEWGAAGYTLWLSSGRRADGTFGRAGIWTGGGYEGTRYWIDPELQQVGVIMTQVFMPPTEGVAIDERIRDILAAQN